MDAQTIYLVDDEAAVRKAVERLLLSLRHPVKPFASAEDFLAAVDGSARGCLILDVGLPGISGLQLQEQLRQRQSPLALIFITANDDAETRDQALRRGAIEYLRKPFAREQLLSSVRKALAKVDESHASGDMG